MKRIKKPASANSAGKSTQCPNSTASPPPRASASSQLLRVLRFLLARGAIGANRYDAERELAVAHLARRIADLRESGCTLTHTDETALDAHGVEHDRIRRYVLVHAPAWLCKAARARMEASHG